MLYASPANASVKIEIAPANAVQSRAAASFFSCPLATLAAGIWVWRATGQLKKDAAARDWTAFAGAISIFTLAFAGLAYSIFPYVVIDRITLWQAASHPSALKMVLIGVAIVLPFLLGYTIFAHRVFRGKAQALLH